MIALLLLYLSYSLLVGKERWAYNHPKGRYQKRIQRLPRLEGAIELRRIVEKALTDVQDVVAPFFRRDMETCGLLRSTNDERTYDQTAACPHRRERERNLNVD